MKQLGLIALLVAGLALAGCSTGGGLAGQYDPDDDSYVSADGTTVVLPAAQRGEPVEFAGVTEHGDDLSSDDLDGQVVLVNFWYAACGPCRTEAADLVALHDEFADAGVAFVGVNVRDSAAQARTFAEKFEIDYPSILDVDDNDVTLAFAGDVPPNAVPTTLLLDAQGRVAARFSGALDGTSVVAQVLDDLLAE